MKAISAELPGVVILEPTVHGDTRGFFLESYRHDRFRELTGFEGDFVQDNHSRSARGVLRGLHYQLPPMAQGKLVRVTAGAVLDVVVDLRRSSSHFGRWIGIELSATNHRQLWIPPGFAHGFLTLSDSADFLYKVTDYYSPAHERCLAWNDPALGIDWPADLVPVLSAKDSQGLGLDRVESFP